MILLLFAPIIFSLSTTIKKYPPKHKSLSSLGSKPSVLLILSPRHLSDIPARHPRDPQSGTPEHTGAQGLRGCGSRLPLLRESLSHLAPRFARNRTYVHLFMIKERKVEQAKNQLKNKIQAVVV